MKLIPKYSVWDALQAVLNLAIKTHEEVRMLKRQPGPAGEDGLGFDDMRVEYDGERTFTFVFEKGKTKRAYPFEIAIPLYRGVYSAEGHYKAGDCVTWGGSSWIATRDTADKPETSDAWRLAVKRGRDGKDGR